MQKIKQGLVLGPSDLVNAIACSHLVQLERLAALGEITLPEGNDPQQAAIAKRGDAHEKHYLAELERNGHQVARFPRAHPTTISALRETEAQTLAAMKSGVAYIYQPFFFDGKWRGQADFLKRVDIESCLGPWSYEIIDTKLARRAKASAVVQLLCYAEHVARLQGRLPAKVHVALGNGEHATFNPSEYAAYTRRMRKWLEETLERSPEATYPHPVSHCSMCRWDARCQGQRRDDDHLSFVANMRRDQADKLAVAGMPTLAAFAAGRPEAAKVAIGARTLDRLHRQAKLQLKQRSETPPGERARVSIEVLAPQTGHGLAFLPPPCSGDVYFDMEGDPLVEDGGLEYLFGAVVRDPQPGKAARFIFHPFWAHSRAEEKLAFEGLVDFIVERRKQWPQLHVYHYAPYETIALSKLAMRHATREEEVDELLRQKVLVDLYQVVRQGVLVSQESYSIKKLEPLYMPPRSAEVKDAGSSIVEYERYLDLRSGQASEHECTQVLHNIAEYNREDCESTALLHAWLEDLRSKQGIPGAASVEAEPPKERVELEAVEALAAELTRELPPDASARTREESGRALLAHLLAWHRREAKPEWWAYFERQNYDANELVADRDCIGDLRYEGVEGTIKQSDLHVFLYDPAQEHKISAGKKYQGLPTGQHEVHSVNRRDGRLVIKRGKRSGAPDIHALIPGKPLDTKNQRNALIALGEATRSGDYTQYQAAFDLLQRHPPRVHGHPGGALVQGGAGLEAYQDLARRLDGSCLPVQGPPGSGKTYVGARMVVGLLQRQRRVGITANSHAVIGNLLGEVIGVARSVGISVRALCRSDDEDIGAIDGVTLATNEEIEAALECNEVDLVAGTPWLMTRPRLRNRLDTLFVDEAGQLSLANALAVATAARNLILLGDPRQLSQPSKGTHPEGAGASALAHVLGDAHTISDERGLFLDTSRRMHPEICAFISQVVYDSKLTAHPNCAHQRVEMDAPLGGGGLRWAPVAHTGCSTRSEQEAARVEKLVHELLGNPWTDSGKRRRLLTRDDILVVAPFNTQVAEIATHLADVRVGTVDKFQGQQAPVVIYSMTCSTAEDAPRDMEFLYELERLNVAVSRAQCLAILICTPQLLVPSCKKPEQMRLANAVCRFVEMASVV